MIGTIGLVFSIVGLMLMIFQISFEEGIKEGEKRKKDEDK